MCPFVPLDDVLFGSDVWCCLATKWIFVVELAGVWKMEVLLGAGWSRYPQI
jgi:hypothetical protein